MEIDNTAAATASHHPTATAAVSALLAHCETLPYGARMRHAFAAGASPSHPDLVASLVSSSSPLYNRLLGLQALRGARDASLAVEIAVSDKSLNARRRAVAVVAEVGSDEQVAACWRGVATVDLRRRLAKLLFKQRRRRAALLNQLLEKEQENGGREFAWLLPFGSEDWVRRLASERADGFSTEDWERLVGVRPRVALEVALEWVARTRGKGDSLWIEAVVKRLIERVGSVKTADGRTAVDLVRESGVPIYPYLIVSLSKALPREAIQFAIEKNRKAIPGSLTKGAWKKLATEELFAVIDWHTSGSNYGWSTPVGQVFNMSNFSDRRLELFQKFGNSWRSGKDAILPVSIINRLPEELRVKEARKSLASVRPDDSTRTTLISLLPWDEAMASDMQGEQLRSSDMGKRQAALGAQLEGVKFQPDRLVDALELARRHKNEDVMCQTMMLEKLISLPNRIWVEAALPKLTELLDDFWATELNYHAAGTFLSLVLRAGAMHPHFAAERFTSVLRSRPGIMLDDRPIARLPASSLSILVKEAFVPIIKEQQERSYWDGVVAFGGLMRDRMSEIPQLLDAYEAGLGQSTNNEQEMIEALKLDRPKALAERLPSLLDTDHSWITLAPFLEVLVAYRQDLLTDHLKTILWKGRHTDEEGEKAPISQHLDRNCSPWFPRWTALQQNAYADVLWQLLEEIDTDTWYFQEYVRQYGQMHYADACGDRIAEIVERKNEDQFYLRTSAIRAAGCLDEQRGVPLLVKTTADDELGRCAARPLCMVLTSFLTPNAALPTMMSAFESATMVSAKKHIVFALSQLKTEDAYETLLGLACSEEAHKDVIAAAVAGLCSRPFYNRERTWEALETAASHKNVNVRDAVCKVPSWPTNVLSPPLYARLYRMFVRLLMDPKDEIRQKIRQRLTRGATGAQKDELRVIDSEGVFYESLMAAFTSDSDWEVKEAGEALLALYIGSKPEVVKEVFTLQLKKRPLWTVGPLVDSFVGLYEHLKYRHEFSDALSKSSTAVAEVLFSERLATRYLMSIFLKTYTGQALRDSLISLEGTERLHADTVKVACNLVRGMEWDGLDDLERTLAASSDDRLRRVGLSALFRLKDLKSRWDRELFERLEKYRADDALLVAEEASNVEAHVIDE